MTDNLRSQLEFTPDEIWEQLTDLADSRLSLQGQEGYECMLDTAEP